MSTELEQHLQRVYARFLPTHIFADEREFMQILQDPEWGDDKTLRVEKDLATECAAIRAAILGQQVSAPLRPVQVPTSSVVVPLPRRDTPPQSKGAEDKGAQHKQSDPRTRGGAIQEGSQQEAIPWQSGRRLAGIAVVAQDDAPQPPQASPQESADDLPEDREAARKMWEAEVFADLMTALEFGAQGRLALKEDVTSQLREVVGVIDPQDAPQLYEVQMEVLHRVILPLMSLCGLVHVSFAPGMPVFTEEGVQMRHFEVQDIAQLREWWDMARMMRGFRYLPHSKGSD